MLSDLKRHYAAGDDLQVLDVQGAAPVSHFLTGLIFRWK